MSASHLAALLTKLLNNNKEPSLSGAELFTLIRHKVRGVRAKARNSFVPSVLNTLGHYLSFCLLQHAHSATTELPCHPHPHPTTPSSTLVSLNNSLLSDHTDGNMVTPQIKQNLVHCAHTTVCKEQKQST